MRSAIRGNGAALVELALLIFASGTIEGAGAGAVFVVAVLVLVVCPPPPTALPPPPPEKTVVAGTVFGCCHKKPSS